MPLVRTSALTLALVMMPETIPPVEMVALPASSINDGGIDWYSIATEILPPNLPDAVLEIGHAALEGRDDLAALAQSLDQERDDQVVTHGQVLA